MAPKETKKDRERRLKKAEELITATGAPTDGPTEDDDEPDEELLYDAEGGLLKPGTSVEARAALAGSTVAVSTALVFTDLSDADGVTTQEEKGSTRTRTRRSTPMRAKRASSLRLSRSRSKPKKKKSKKDRRRRPKKESSSSSSDADRRRGRGRSSSSSGSSASSSGDSDWEELYDHETVVKFRELLKAAPPRATASRRSAEADDDNTDDWQAELLHDVDEETFEKLDNIAADIDEMASRERWLFCRSCKSWHTVPCSRRAASS
jgi:hypothetical protein